MKACDAFLVVNEDDDIVASEENHNHGSRLTVKDQMKVPAGKRKYFIPSRNNCYSNKLFTSTKISTNRFLRVLIKSKIL